MTRLPDYRYDECGLDNVILQGLPACKDDHGEDVITIPNVNLLHKVLATAVAAKPTGLVGKEIRFLRTEMGMTQAELGVLMGRDAQTVGRWERGEFPIEKAFEMILRAAALENIKNEFVSMLELAQKSVPSSTARPYVIDARDPKNYRAIAA
jgi:transcriptional regulator with XRE-family HTH domain